MCLAIGLDAQARPKRESELTNIANHTDVCTGLLDPKNRLQSFRQPLPLSFTNPLRNPAA